MTSQDNSGKKTAEASEWATLAGFGLCTTYLIFLIATHLREGGAAMTLPHDSALLDIALLPARSFGLLGAYLVTSCLCGMTLLLWMKQKLLQLPRRAIGLPLLILALSSLVALIEGGSSVWGGLSGELLRDAYEMVLPRPMAYILASVLVIFGMIMARDWFFFDQIHRILTNQPAAPAFALGIGGDASEIENADVQPLPKQDRKARSSETPTFELGGHISMDATAELLEPGNEIESLGSGKSIFDDLDLIESEVKSKIPTPEDKVAEVTSLDVSKTGLIEQVDVEVIPEELVEIEAEELPLPAPTDALAIDEEIEENLAAEVSGDLDEESNEFDPMEPSAQLDWSSPVSVHSDVDLFGAMVDDADEERSLDQELSTRESSRRRRLDSEVVNSASVLDEAISDLTDDLDDLDDSPEQEFDGEELEFEEAELEEDELAEDFDDEEETSQEFEEEDEDEVYELEDDEEFEEKSDQDVLQMQEEEDEAEEENASLEYEEIDETEDALDPLEVVEQAATVEDSLETESLAAPTIPDDANETVLVDTLESMLTDDREKSPVAEPSQFGTDTTNLLDTAIDELFDEEEETVYDVDDFANIIVEDAGEKEVGVEQVDYEVTTPTSFHGDEIEPVDGDLVDEPEEIEIQHLLFGSDHDTPSFDNDLMPSAYQEIEADVDEIEESEDEVVPLPVLDEESESSPSELELYGSSASITEEAKTPLPTPAPIALADEDDWAPWGEDSAPPRPAHQEVAMTTATETSADETDEPVPELEKEEDVDWFEAEFAMLDDVEELDADESEELEQETQEAELAVENPVEIEAESEISGEILDAETETISVELVADELPVTEETEVVEAVMEAEESAVNLDTVEDSELSEAEEPAAEPTTVQAGALESPFEELAEDFYQNAVALCLKEDSCRISFLQRNLRIHFAQAAAIIERMESEGIVGPYSGSGSHEILVNYQDWRTDGM